MKKTEKNNTAATTKTMATRLGKNSPQRSFSMITKMQTPLCSVHPEPNCYENSTASFGPSILLFKFLFSESLFENCSESYPRQITTSLYTLKNRFATKNQNSFEIPLVSLYSFRNAPGRMPGPSAGHQRVSPGTRILLFSPILTPEPKIRRLSAHLFTMPARALRCVGRPAGLSPPG